MSTEIDTLLTALEEKFDRLSAAWAADYVRVRALRLEFRGLISALFELANTSEPTEAKRLRDFAAHLSARAKAVDARVAASLPPGAPPPHDDASPKELADAVASWRKRIGEARERMAKAREALIS